MSKVMDRSILEVADEIFIDRERTRESVLKLIEDMSQDRSLTSDERQNRIEIIIQAMK